MQIKRPIVKVPKWVKVLFAGDPQMMRMYVRALQDEVLRQGRQGRRQAAAAEGKGGVRS